MTKFTKQRKRVKMQMRQMQMCSLPKDAVAKEIPDYYGGKRVGPGELVHVSTIYESEKYCEMLHRQLMKYLAWIEVRKLKRLSP